jgi:hypothetical protein
MVKSGSSTDSRLKSTNPILISGTKHLFDPNHPLSTFTYSRDWVGGPPDPLAWRHEREPRRRVDVETLPHPILIPAAAQPPN